jgi:phosphoinositide-3-kinase regulatory subunit 4
MITNRGNIRALDLRTMKEIWVLNSSPEYGEITACLFNKKSRWLLTGTSRGVVCLWDTRFQIQLKVWNHPSGGPITKISSHYRESSKLVAIASLNDVSLWDISKVECLQVWCSLRGNAKEGSPEDVLRRAYPSGFKVPLIVCLSDSSSHVE